MTRQQQDLKDAFDNVSSLVALAEKTKKTYGSLCHGFPILVRTNGLCQTLAFVADKKGGNKAYEHLWSHVAATLHKTDAELLTYVSESSNAQYLFDTRRIMDAWVYYKRFAVSILHVKAGEEGEE